MASFPPQTSLSIRAEAVGKISYHTSQLTPTKETQFLVKTVYSGISGGTERKTLLGEVPSFKKHWNSHLRIYQAKGPLKSFPASLGYEAVGKVVQKGSEVNDVEINDLVWIDGSHSQYHLLDQGATNYLRLPSSLEPQSAVFLPLTRVAMGAVHDSKIVIGDKVIVIGQGVVGSLAAQLSILNGAEVVVFDKSSTRSKCSKELGLSVISPTTTDPAEYLRKRHGWVRGADVAIEASGSYLGLELALRTVGLQGKVVTVGSYPSESTTLALGEEWHKNKITLISSMTINGCYHHDFPRWDLDRLNQYSVSLLSSSKITVNQLISHRIPFLKAKKAYDLLINKPTSSMKILLTY